MRTKPMQLSIMAVAALAVFAVAAVMLLSGGNPAQATTAENVTPTSGGGHLLPLAADPTPDPTPRFPGEPPCPGETGNTNSLDPVVDSGQIALFDVWWNPHEGELTNSSCPPTVTHVPAGEDADLNPIPARDDRSASNIDIAETVIHIPNGAKVQLNETAHPKAKFQDLWDADEAESASGGDGYVWSLPVCPDSPATTALCLSFSAGLLNDADWVGDIVYHVAHVHQIDIDKQDPRYVLVYEGPTKRDALRWNSQDLHYSDMPVPAGEYDRPKWFFTSPGTYEFQVNITGTPNPATDRSDGLPPVSLDGTVSSDIRTYLIHVGAESDLGVTMTAAPESPAPGDLVTITLTASNGGPDAAPSAKVDVALQDGLEYVSHEPTTATFGVFSDADTSDDEESENTCPCETPEFEPTHTWSIGALAKDASQTLTIKARAAQGTRGQNFDVNAKISATQTVTTTSGNFDVPVPDKVSSNDMAMRTITVPSIPNVDSMFGIRCIIDAVTAPRTHVCSAIVLADSDSADTIDTLTYNLEGPHSEHFMLVKDTNRDIDIEVKESGYPRQPILLDLTVTDGKDAHGNPDSSIDDRIKVVIIVRGGDDYYAN